MDAAPPASLGVILMTVIVGLAALCVIAYSLLGRREPWDIEAGAGLLSRLRKRREQLLRAMKDLEMGRESGALSEGEFRSLRGELKRRAIGASRDLERVRRTRWRSILKSRRGITPSRRKQIEELVRQRTERMAAAAPPPLEGESP